jgi:hypothetical protein
MARYTLILTAFILAISSCGPSKKTVSYAEDKAFYDALKKLEKDPNDKERRSNVVDLYTQAVRQHEDRVNAYRNSPEMNRYDKMIAEYNSLQKLNESIRTSSVFREVSPRNYLNDLQAVRQEGAEAFYQSGLRNLDYRTKRDARKAYEDFRKAKSYVSNYKDVDRMMNLAYEASVVNVLVNPIQNAMPGMWNNTWNVDPRFGFMHEQLARDLGGQSGNTSARFFTDMDIRRMNIRPDWIIDVNWSYMSGPPNVTNRYDRPVSRNIEIGRDTSGRPIYQSVRATLHISRFQMPSSDIDYRIVDVETNRTLEWNRIQTSLNNQVYETATFTGDSRALSSSDWALVNNRGNQNQEQVIRNMYNDLLSELRMRIQARL